MLRLPNGESAGMMDSIVLLMLWAQHLDVQLRAGMGKPTFPVNAKVVAYASSYWEDLARRTQMITPLLESKANPQVHQDIVDAHLAIDYGDPYGDKLAREKMSHALSRWYECEINPQDILFTTGGLGGLYCVFEYLRRKYLHSKILTPFPYYPFYSLGNHLFPIPVMESPGYRLTAAAIKKSIIAAHQVEKFEHEALHAVVLCYPNNPLGTVLRKKEWEEIAKELEAIPNALIVLDEAYAELDFTQDGTSLYTVAPQLRDRIVLMRSGTKGLSAAGERLAILVCKNNAVMTRLLEINSTISLHPPRHLQMAFATAMDAWTDFDKQQLKSFYQPQVQYAQKRLRAMQALLPDPNYQVEGSFYVMANLKKLLGSPMSQAAQCVFSHPNTVIKTDEDLVYSLLFEDKIMLAPGSYFGLDPSLGYVRITCSMGERDLGEILDKIERRLSY
jgi:aspartate aminotransferase/aminotransferase